MTDANKCKTVMCLICKKEIKPFMQNLFACFPCEEAYYITDEGNLDYYAHLGEFIPVTRKHLPIPDFNEMYCR